MARPDGSASAKREGELSRPELEREAGEPLPDREGTFDRLSDRATAERASRSEDPREEETVA